MLTPDIPYVVLPFGDNDCGARPRLGEDGLPSVTSQRVGNGER